MCIVAIAWQAHPKWKLIAIGNRDELHARPTSPLVRWTDHGHIIAGQDQQAGGTWLGVSEQGRFAVITNVAESTPPIQNAASRGQLLKDFLSNDGSYSNLRSIDASVFNAFNLFTVAGDDACILSNRSSKPNTILQSGIYGLSNGALADPWSKSEKLNTALDSWLSNDATNFQYLIHQLQDEEPVAQSTDVNLPINPQHSAIFIKNRIYGTRCSSLVAIDHEGKGTFIEKRFDRDGGSMGENRIEFSWPG